ncbi:hypothetical protein [Amycolatopsis thailandensis]|uniref:hypothetical protein n=1 Tax=Amycolatopsis thailandensis TaxID=589330 RepID=UPI00362F2C4E
MPPNPFHAAEFVPDPSSPLDELANSVHASAFDLVKQVLTGLGEQGELSPVSPGFLAQYAAAAGLGLVVMAFSAVFAVLYGMRRGGRHDLRESLFKYLPVAVFLIVFFPAIGVLVTNVANAATAGIANWGATTIGQTTARVDQLAGITAEDLPGGTFVGLLVSLLIVVGALGVFLVLAVEKIGLPVAGIIAGVAWGMLVHPAWRPKALRIPGFWLGLVFAEPLLFLLLAGAFGAFGSASGELNGVPGLIQLCLLAVALILSSAVPFVVVRKLASSGSRLSVATSSSPRAPVGVRGPVTVALERTGSLQLPVPEQGFRMPSHTIAQAYERGQRERMRPQQDRGQAERRQETGRPEYIGENSRTEKMSSPPRPGRM